MSAVRHYRRGYSQISITNGHLLSQKCNLKRKSVFVSLSSKLLYIYINTINLCNIKSGGQKCHTTLTPPGSHCPPVVNRSTVPVLNLLSLLAFLYFVIIAKRRLNIRGTRLFLQRSIIPACTALGPVRRSEFNIPRMCFRYLGLT